MSDSWQEDSLQVVEGIVELLDTGIITKEKANELVVKYGIYDLKKEDLME